MGPQEFFYFGWALQVDLNELDPPLRRYLSRPLQYSLAGLLFHPIAYSTRPHSSPASSFTRSFETHSLTSRCLSTRLISFSSPLVCPLVHGLPYVRLYLDQEGGTPCLNAPTYRPANLLSPHFGNPYSCSAPPALLAVAPPACSQMLAPLHSLHRLLIRWCSQMLDPPHSLHWLLRRWCS